MSFLQQNPGKAAAWARVFGINPSGLPSYVATLSPVVLTSDTYVTNHGYQNGVANPIRSVLQAGTAVLVDRTGTPRVKCNCGNPLTPADPVALADARTTGTQWPGYSPTTVTAVQPGPTTDNLTLVDIESGDNFRQPTGGGGGPGGDQGSDGDLTDGTYKVETTASNPGLDNSCGEAVAGWTLSVRGNHATLTTPDGSSESTFFLALGSFGFAFRFGDTSSSTQSYVASFSQGARPTLTHNGLVSGTRHGDELLCVFDWRLTRVRDGDTSTTT